MRLPIGPRLTTVRRSRKALQRLREGVVGEGELRRRLAPRRQPILGRARSEVDDDQFLARGLGDRRRRGDAGIVRPGGDRDDRSGASRPARRRQHHRGARTERRFEQRSERLGGALGRRQRRADRHDVARTQGCGERFARAGPHDLELPPREAARRLDEAALGFAGGEIEFARRARRLDGRQPPPSELISRAKGMPARWRSPKSSMNSPNSSMSNSSANSTASAVARRGAPG